MAMENKLHQRQYTTDMTSKAWKALNFACWLRSYDDLCSIRTRPTNHNLTDDEMENAESFAYWGIREMEGTAHSTNLLPTGVRIADLKGGKGYPPALLEWASELIPIHLPIYA